MRFLFFPTRESCYWGIHSARVAFEQHIFLLCVRRNFEEANCTGRIFFLVWRVSSVERWGVRFAPRGATHVKKKKKKAVARKQFQESAVAQFVILWVETCLQNPSSFGSAILATTENSDAAS